MAYLINKTDGTILATVADGQIDQFSSDLTLIGKNYSGFGESLNENFVKLLENFAGISRPEKPIRGQIWFDTTENKLKVYNGSAFVPVSSATISSTRPLTLGVGDLWFNDVDKQLFFFDGVNTILLGPDYSESQGLSGLRVANILDSLNQNRVITYLYNNGILLGIFSKDEFQTKTEILGFGPAGSQIIPGFNSGSLAGLKFKVTATNSETLGKDGIYPNGVPASVYVRNDTSNIINGQLIISSNLGIIIGDANQGQFGVQDGNLIFANIASEKNISLVVRKGALPETAIGIGTEFRKVKLYENYLDSEVVVGGNLTVNGDLEVKGEVLTVNTSVVTIEDKNLELAVVENPTDLTAEGGGIILKGSTDKEFLWSQTTSAWNSTENINLADSKSIKINGVTILTANECLVPSFPNVNQFGPQLSLTVDDIFVNDNIIKVNPENTDLVLDINGIGKLNLSGKGISNVLNPRPGSEGLQDAATREYVDSVVETRNLVLTLDVSDGISNTGIAALLNQIAPIGEYRLGTLARVLCVSAFNSNSTFDINALTNTSSILVNTPSGTAPVLNSVSFNAAVVPGQSILLSRTVKTFRRESTSWTFVS
jgi:hypothetical protein